MITIQELWEEIVRLQVRVTALETRTTPTTHPLMNYKCVHCDKFYTQHGYHYACGAMPTCPHCGKIQFKYPTSGRMP